MRILFENRYRNTISMLALVFIILFFLGVTTPGVSAMAIRESDFRSYPRSVQAITWEASIVESGITTIDGYVRFPQGGLELTWTVDASGNARLYTLDPSGSAELPPHTVRIHPVLFDDGTTLLAKEFFPLLNSRQPVSVKIVGAVEAANLLAPLELIEIPQGSTNHHALSRITFGNQYEIKGKKVQEGMISYIGGSLNLLWQKYPDGSYKLASVDQGLEIPLIPMLDKKSATAYIFEIKTAEAQGFGIDYLRYVGKTALDELLEGFSQL